MLFKFHNKVHVFGDKRVIVGGMGRERKTMIEVVVLPSLMVGQVIANVPTEQRQ